MSFKSASLPRAVLAIIHDKGTERPFTGEYHTLTGEAGTYLCRQCGWALFRADAQFNAGCGWPSFDREIAGHVRRVPDRDGLRTEILCARCEAHLGHVFMGERHTPLNTRHCVNSLSLDFVTDKTVEDTQEAIFAAGCFWGVEYYFKKHPGVLKTEVGYIGGHSEHPSYEEVCSGHTGHYEAIRVVFDPTKTSYEAVAKYFFEIHDPSQTDGQGPDYGEQYLSAIFYYDDAQKNTALDLIRQLHHKGYEIATKLCPMKPFWPAETYHQDYYTKTHKAPYCHKHTKRF